MIRFDRLIVFAKVAIFSRVFLSSRIVRQVWCQKVQQGRGLQKICFAQRENRHVIRDFHKYLAISHGPLCI